MALLEQQPDVLKQFAGGEPEAFETLFRQFQGEVYGWIVRIVRDAAIAEDLTVETFWRIHRAHARYDPSRCFGAWARRIATNVAIDHLNRAPGREVDLEAADSARSRINPGNPAIQREVRERVQLAFEQLPAKLRVVAALALVEEQPQAEIADALGISTAAVKSRLFRAVRLLRRKLGNLDTTYE